MITDDRNPICRISLPVRVPAFQAGGLGSSPSSVHKEYFITKWSTYHGWYQISVREYKIARTNHPDRLVLGSVRYEFNATG